MPKIAIRSGHMKNVDGGAVGILNEYDVNRAYAPEVIKALNRCGFEVVDCTPEQARDMADSLQQGVNKANNEQADLFVSCHTNAFNGQAYGSTVVYYNGSYNGKLLAESILKEIVALGFTDRKISADTRGLYELKYTDMPAVIVEPFFLDNQGDVELYKSVGAKGLGEAVAKGICKFYGVQYVEEVTEMTLDYALEILTSKGIINSPEYWKNASGVVNHLDQFIMNVAKNI